MEVANWADEIKGDPKFNAFAPLHYADVYEEYKSYQDSPPVKGGDVVSAIETLTQFLQTKKTESLKQIPALSNIDAAVAVKLLVHFIGDVHQPLHVIEGKTSQGQPLLGGNIFRINWFKRWETNVHSIWDDEMVDFERLSYTEYASYLDHASQNQISTWINSSVVQWANESLSYRTQVYTFPDQKPTSGEAGISFPVLVSYGYISANRDTLRLRLLQGGLRLGNVLNSIFGH